MLSVVRRKANEGGASGGRITASRDTNDEGDLLAHSKSYYDEMGRVYKSETINPGDTETAEVNTYVSKGGKVKKTTDPYGKSTTYAYDTAGRQTLRLRPPRRASSGQAKRRRTRSATSP